MGHPWLFEFGAFLYGVMTAQETWRSSCARLANYLPDRTDHRPRRVLDLGCGPGVSTIVVAHARPEARVTGLDVASRMLTQAVHYTERAGLDHSVSYVLADAARLPFKDASWDLVTGHSFLYLVENRDAILREAYRVLGPGGRFASMEPRKGRKSLRALLEHWRNWRYILSVILWRPYSRWLHAQFTDESLRKLLAAAGFRRTATEIVLDGYGIIGSGEKP
jgi:ubiquinone/menaquinone biosynthesis C-methylase UbiE